MMNADEKPTKNVKMEKMIKKRFLKKKANLNTMMFESVNVKNLNARTFMIFYINDTTSFANIFILKQLFEFENFSEIENDASI